MQAQKVLPVYKVQVWVFCRDEVLLLKTTPERGGGWQPVTGSVEAGEDSREAAARELGEETGITLSVDALIDTGFEFEFESRWGGIARERVWCSSVDEKPAIRMDPVEHVGFVWRKTSQAKIFLEHESSKKALDLAHQAIDKKFFGTARPDR